MCTVVKCATSCAYRCDEDQEWLTWMQKQFTDIAGEDGLIDLNEFKKALGVKKVSYQLTSAITVFVPDYLSVAAAV